MNGTITKILKKECTTSDGKKFSVLDISCNVLWNEESGEIKQLKSSMSLDYAKKYFEYCHMSTKDAIGKKVNVIVSKKEITKKDGTVGIYTFIKYLNFLDENDKPIIMPKEENNIGF